MTDTDPHLKKIVDAVKNVTQGNFNETVSVDTTGLVGELAHYINQTISNLRQLDKNLGANAKDTPLALSEVHEVSHQTEKATMLVLDRAEEVLSLLGKSDPHLEALKTEIGDGPQKEHLEAVIANQRGIEAAMFEIINSQEFQDVTQQKIAKVLKALEAIESRLVDLLMLFKINEDREHKDENVEILKSLHDESFDQSNKQNLVEQLLAEFGM